MSELLGTFEQAVMLAVAGLGENAYGRSILTKVSSSMGRDVAAGAVYATLDRVEQKGLAASYLAAGSAERGGRAKRYYRLTGAGIKALHQSKEALERIWASTPWPEAGKT